MVGTQRSMHKPILFLISERRGSGRRQDLSSRRVRIASSSEQLVVCGRVGLSLVQPVVAADLLLRCLLRKNVLSKSMLLAVWLLTLGKVRTTRGLRAAIRQQLRLLHEMAWHWLRNQAAADDS